jgi:PAS domain S-box-containing protein
MIKLLIVDDNPDNLVELNALLSEAFPGAGIYKALNGKDGIASALSEAPDVIILDIVMPDMDGLEVCSNLKSDDRVKHIPVILLTEAGDDKEIRVKSLQSGADAFLAKPFDDIELRVQVSAMLRIKESEDKLRRESEYLSRLVGNETRELAEKLKEQKKNAKNLRVTLEKLEKSRIASLNLMEDLRSEIDSRKKSEEELKVSESKFRSLFTSMQEGFALHKIICDEKGRPVDYRFLDVNPAFEKLTGLSADKTIGRTVLELMPETEHIWIREYGKVALEMKEFGFEHYSRALGRFYRVLAFSPVRGQFATLFEDVTEQRKAEKAIRDSEQKFRIIFESVGSGLIYMSKTGEIIDVNPAFEKMTGYKKEWLTGKNVISLSSSILTTGETSYILEALKDTFKGKRALSFPFSFNDHYLNGSTFFSEGKNMIIAVVNDVTDQKKAEEERYALLLRQNAILGAIPDIIMEVNLDMVYTWANEAGNNFFGNDVIGKRADHYFEGRQKTYDIVQPLFMGDDTPVYVESWQRRKDGEKRLLAWWCKTLKNKDDKVIGGLSSARDITDSKNKELEIEKSREQLQHLNLYLQKAREEERKLISRELHDQLGQLLTAIKIDLGSLKLWLDDKRILRQRIQKISELISESIGTVKHLTSELRPHILDDLGLIAALEWYASEFSQRTGIKLNLKLNKEIEPENEFALVIFRIFQEAMTNIARHSRACSAEIVLSMITKYILLVIHDDGSGLPEDVKLSSRSYGLLNMHERAKEIGGTLEIDSGPGQGTKITLKIPWGWEQAQWRS